MAKKTQGTFTALSQSSAVVLGKEAEAILSGTFTATVVPEVQDGNGNWVPYDGVSFAAPGAARFKMALTRPWRLTVTAFTAGPVVYELAGEEFPSQI